MPLSITSKLDGIKSWSLQASDTCPGAIGADACNGCYALAGNYRFPNVKNIRIQNKKEWQQENWVGMMIQQLEKERYFRWFDSGDCYSIKLAEKIYKIISATPHCQHWLPTRMFKFKKFQPILQKIQVLPNASVRFSSDSIDGHYDERHGSTIIPHMDYKTKAFICKAYQNDGKCNGCRACFDKNIKTIAYVAHGRSMVKQLKLKNILN